MHPRAGVVVPGASIGRMGHCPGAVMMVRRSVTVSPAHSNAAKAPSNRASSSGDGGMTFALSTGSRRPSGMRGSAAPGGHAYTRITSACFLSAK